MKKYINKNTLFLKIQIKNSTLIKSKNKNKKEKEDCIKKKKALLLVMKLYQKKKKGPREREAWVDHATLLTVPI